MKFLISKTHIKLLLVVFYATTFLCAEEEVNSFSFKTTNNINLKGQVADQYGDNLNTGSLEVKYKTAQYTYSVNMTAYTQKYPELKSSLTDLSRIDTLELGVIRKIKTYQANDYKLNIHIGATLLLSGNFGGEKLQDFIHENLDLEKSEIPYSSHKHNAIGIVGNIDYLNNINPFLKLYGKGKTKIYSDTSGTISLELGTLLVYRSIEMKLGLGAKHIKPFQQELVKILTINKNPKYLLCELKIPLIKKISMNIGTILAGDHPYGNNQNDPFSYLNISYTF